MKLLDVLVIEDSDKLWGTKYKINSKEEIPDYQVYAGPMKICDAEYFENILISKNVPYVMIQAETSVENIYNETAYSKGYIILADC